MLLWMIEIWMKNYLVSDNIYNDVNILEGVPVVMSYTNQATSLFKDVNVFRNF